MNIFYFKIVLYLLFLTFHFGGSNFIAATSAQAFDAENPANRGASILIYHRFGEDRYPATNIRLDQFERHLALLQVGGFQVLPLPEIVARLSGEGPPLPEKAVAITVDDAYASVYHEAFPRLKAAGFPFSVFVATDEVDGGGSNYMTWDQLRTLADEGVTIGAHSASHGHLAQQDKAAVAADLLRSNKRFQAELGQIPPLFAYPYGEYSLATQAQARSAGYRAAFGQQSGVANSASDFFALPRFPMNEAYGDEERFLQAVKALPFPVRDVQPADPLLSKNPPDFSFSIDSDLIGPAEITCYASGLGTVPVRRAAERIHVTLSRPFPPGRARVNCTQWAAPDQFRWFGIQFVIDEGTRQ